MTDKKIPNINIVDLSKKREERKKEEDKVPAEIVKKIEDILQKAKDGKLVSIVMNFRYDIEDDEKDDEKDDGNHGSMYYNKSQSPLEVLGTVEMMKAQVFQLIYQDYMEETEDE